uniref:Secreted protein n=1 Tax=Opuntia streptacantha TaxID=393608 RepID=A0A7C9DCU4_OPUST
MKLLKIQIFFFFFVPCAGGGASDWERSGAFLKHRSPGGNAAAHYQQIQSLLLVDEIPCKILTNLSHTDRSLFRFFYSILPVDMVCCSASYELVLRYVALPFF